MDTDRGRIDRIDQINVIPEANIDRNTDKAYGNMTKEAMEILFLWLIVIRTVVELVAS